MAASNRAGMVWQLLFLSAIFNSSPVVSSAPFVPYWSDQGTPGSPPVVEESGTPGVPGGGSWTTYTTVYSTVTAGPPGEPTSPVETDPGVPTSTAVAPFTPPTSAATSSTTIIPSTPATSIPSSPPAVIPTSPIVVTTSATQPATSATSAVPTGTAVPGTLPLKFYNNLKQNQTYAIITGTDLNGQTVMLTQNGEWYYPSSTSDTSETIPSSANVVLSLNGHGQMTQITLPNYVTSARLWVSQTYPLQFGVTNGGLVEPSATNDDDPNHNTNWGFLELTFNSAEDGGLYANLSFVDFIGLPLGMKVIGTGNSTQSALGPHKAGKEEVCARLQKQGSQDGQPWNQLCKIDTAGNIIRVVSPQTLVTQNTSAFASYFDEYVEAVWNQYTSTPLAIETQSNSIGTINCTASSSTSQILCEGDDTPFTKPTSGDIFGCSTGPFANTGNDVHLAAVPRVCAAFNRATLHLPGGNVQPHLPPSAYYLTPATNFYARFVHQVELDGKGYAFSYDDVSPDMSVYNTAGLVAVPEPIEMKIFVGGYRGDEEEGWGT